MKRKNTTFLVYYNFKHTAGNHAGMSYLAKYLSRNLLNIRLIKNIQQEFRGGSFIAKLYAIYLAFWLKLTLRTNDKIFFFEYLTKRLAHQDLTLKILRLLGCRNKAFGLVHLSGSHLLELYNDEKNVLNRLELLDEVYVLGSSLKDFLLQIGYKKKIVLTYHYVDTEFYKPIKYINNNTKLQVICMGSLKRNTQKLKQIVQVTPNIFYHICMGGSNFEILFNDCKNVKLYSFLTEEELLLLMQKCDVGLSVLEDTVGSNVITTSLSVGLAQIVSDVGSIRDYCNSKNSFLCKEEEDFVKYLNILDSDRELLKKMKENAIIQSQTISKEFFLNFFYNAIQD